MAVDVPIPTGRVQVATPATMAASIRNSTEATRAVDERIEDVAADIIAADPTVKTAAAGAVSTQVAARSLLSQGDRVVPTDEVSAFTVAVGQDVALQVDAAANTHLGSTAIVPSQNIQFATGDGRVHLDWSPATGVVWIGSLEVGEIRNAGISQKSAGLVTFGDSMTYSQEGAGTTWPNELAALSGIPTMNYGKPAWGSGNVAMLAGATTPRVTVTGGSIPASGSVAVTVTPVDGWRKSGAGTLWCRVLLAGVAGSLEYNLASQTWAFKRETAGDIVPVPANSPVIPTEVDWSRATGFDFTVWVGRNNASETSAVLRDLQAFEQLARRRGVRILTLGVSPVRGDATDLATVVALNAQIQANASVYFDVRGWLATTDPETATSLSYATGQPQARFYAPDGVHFNALGYKTLARGLHFYLTSLGWS